MSFQKFRLPSSRRGNMLSWQFLHLAQGAKSRALAKRVSDTISQSRASSLVKGFENAAPAWLDQALPCAFPIRVYPCHPWFKIHRTTRFHSNLAFLKLINNPNSIPVIARYPIIWAIWDSLNAATTLASTTTFPSTIKSGTSNPTA